MASVISYPVKAVLVMSHDPSIYAIDPAFENVTGSVPDGTVEDVSRAAARAAQRLRRLTFTNRCQAATGGVANGSGRWGKEQVSETSRRRPARK